MSSSIRYEIAVYTAAIIRSRREYEEHPTACADSCSRCVWPVGSSPDCDTCKTARRMRRIRAKEAAR